jgi:cell pole-organizing protein PopZ
MSQPAKVPEPSIDEILASIRRSIVPDDDASKPAARKPASRKSAAAAASAPSSARGRRVDAERTDLGAAGDQGSDGASYDDPPLLKREARLPEGEQGWVHADNVPGDPEEGTAPGIARTEAMESGAGRASASDAPLLSPQTSAAVDTAFNSLAHTAQSQNPRTLEDLVRDMLKPMLKAWLDANLPDIVERLVRAEIERVSRRR